MKLVAMLMLAAMIPVAPCAEPEFLGEGELRALITGKTIEVQVPGSTAKGRVYFDASGQRVSLDPISEQQLPWRILPDGLHCVRTSTGDDCARVRRNPDGTFTRVRDGQDVTSWLRIIDGKDLDVPGIYLRQTGTNAYLFLLVSSTALTEREAQLRIAQAAAPTCRERVPAGGRYRSDSTQRIGDADRQKAAFRFTQEVTCVARAPAPSPRAPLLRLAEEGRRIETDIRSRSEAYLRAVATGQFAQAFRQVSGVLAEDEAGWMKQKREFQASLGEIRRVSVVRMTVYDNPGEAAEPGIYVAADFNNEYSTAPVHCGYLMWFRPASGGEFTLTREETGHITAMQWAGMTPAEQQESRELLKCRAP